MVDRDELISHFDWLAESDLLDQVLGEAALAIELCAAGHDWEWMRYGAALMTAGGVVEVFGLEPHVERVREARAAGTDLCFETVLERCRRVGAGRSAADRRGRSR